jgi:twitching motility protein PilT
MISMDQSLAELFHAGKISRETAVNYAEHPDQIGRHL